MITNQTSQSWWAAPELPAIQASGPRLLGPAPSGRDRCHGAIKTVTGADRAGTVHGHVRAQRTGPSRPGAAAGLVGAPRPRSAAPQQPPSAWLTRPCYPANTRVTGRTGPAARLPAAAQEPVCLCGQRSCPCGLASACRAPAHGALPARLPQFECVCPAQLPNAGNGRVV